MNPSDLLERARTELERATPSEHREAANLYDAHRRAVGFEAALDVLAEYSALPTITRYTWLATARLARASAPAETTGPTGRVFLEHELD